MNKEKLVLTYNLLVTIWRASPLRTIFTLLVVVIKHVSFTLKFWSLIQLIDAISTAANGSSQLIELYHHLFLFFTFVLIHQILQLIAIYALNSVKEYGVSLIQTKLIKAVALVPLHLKETPKYKGLLAQAEQAIDLNDTMFFSNFVKLVDLIMELICVLILLCVIHWLIAILALQMILAYLILERKNLSTNALLKDVGREEQHKVDYIMDLATSKSASLEVTFFGLAGYLANLWSSLRSSITIKLSRFTITTEIGKGQDWMDYLVPFTWLLLLSSALYLLHLDIISISALIILLDLIRRLDRSFSAGGSYFTEIKMYLEKYFASLWSLLETGNYAENIFSTRLFMPGLEDEMLTTPIDKIEFDNVYFTYPDYSIGIRQATVSINRGEVIALVGPNGAGKSTFIKLLLGIYFPDQGTILVDNYPLNKNNVYHWWGRISVVFQDYARFGLTIREGVGFTQLEDEVIWTALKKVGLSELVRKLPAGLDTVLGTDIGGYQPSGGQWQRFALARAFAKNGDIVIFDEPTASLDVFSEEQVFQEFRELSRGKIGVFASHRLGPVKFADKIILFQGGKIVEVGNHQQLISAGGLYAQMYKTQAKGYTQVG